MCFSSPNYDVEFANKAVPRRKPTHVAAGQYTTQTRISETVTWDRKPAVEYVPAPLRSSLPPLIRTVTPPKPLLALLPAPPPDAPIPPPPSRVELVSVVGSIGGSPRASRTSVTGHRPRRSRDEVYIERERETVRLDPGPKPSGEMDVFTYMEQPRRDSRVSLESGGRRSITYETNPRLSSRTVERERERVIVEDGGRRREYYRKK